jgi:hypothetical protein
MALLAGTRRLDGKLNTDTDTATGGKGRARELAGWCLARRAETEALSLPGHTSLATNPTLFTGAAGAAYAFLRVRSPNQLPCVLLLE